MFENFLTLVDNLKSNAFFIAFAIPHYFFFDAILTSLFTVELPPVNVADVVMPDIIPDIKTPDSSLLKTEELKAKILKKDEIKKRFKDDFGVLLNISYTQALIECQTFYKNELFFNCIKDWLEANKENDFEDLLKKMASKNLKDVWINDFKNVLDCESADDFNDLNLDTYKVVHIIKKIKEW